MYSFFHHPRKIYNYIGVCRIPEKFNSLRRFDYRHISEFSILIIYLWLLAVGFRIGTISFVMLSDVMDMNLAQSLYKIDLPASKTKEELFNKRLERYLIINEEGYLKIDGSWVNRSDLPDALKRIKRDMPNTVITLIVDKNCRMEHVLNTIESIKKAKIRRVFFLTKKKF